VALVHDRDRHVQPAVLVRLRGQKQEEALDAERATGRGHVRPAELLDEVVVAPAAG
jgi:hypothetical protein